MARPHHDDKQQQQQQQHRRGGRYRYCYYWRTPLFATFVVVVSISTIWQSSEINVILSRNTIDSNDYAEYAYIGPTILVGSDDGDGDGDGDGDDDATWKQPMISAVVEASVSEFRSFPRLVHLDDDDDDDDEMLTVTTTTTTTPAASTINKKRRKIKYTLTLLETMEKALNGNEDPVYREFEKEWYTQCEPVKNIAFRPICNSLHELGAFEPSLPSSSSPTTTTTALLSMEGSWRSVWKTEDPVAVVLAANEQEQHHHHVVVILKLLQLHRDFDSESFQAHQMDSRVMERLSASPRVVSSYGFCGQSVLTQLAQSSGSSVMKDSTLSWRDRLVLASELAQGLAELHALVPIDWERMLQQMMKRPDPISVLLQESLKPKQYPPIFAHYDINIANTISLEPKHVQWNDFNLGMITSSHHQYSSPSSSKGTTATTNTTNTNTNTNTTTCPLPVRYQGIMWRSPEEIQNALGQLPTLTPSDVYSFGNLLYTVFTKHQPWTHLEEGADNLVEDEIATKKLRGDLPNLPSKYQPQQIQRPEAKVLWAATRACFRREPHERPTAYRLAASLGLALKYIQSRKELSDEMIERIFA